MLEVIFRCITDEAFFKEVILGFSNVALFIFIVLCIFVLSKGADWMIDGVIVLARKTGLPKIVIGATVISLGTTTPEMFVSVMAAWMGNPGLALGNGVGSIIADTGLIFGLTCLLTVTPINRFILNRQGWIQVGSATLLVIISLIALVKMEGQPVLNRWVGFLFLFLLGCFLYASYYWAMKATETDDQETCESETFSLKRCWLMVIGGLSMVVVSAWMLVPCACEIAKRMGVPEDVIAATMVAFGTSLPELITAFAAVRKGHPEITIGNVVGADILNCLFVIGAAAATRPLYIPPNFFKFHFPAMIIILYSFRIFIFINRDDRFRRWQGGWLFGIYLVYIILQYSLNIGE
ncbi:MAG: calcium/sodium antiporter [Thermodesulfobacteriota bacterium]|nr:calcium/sodium antiporter [Thermodesulfobacteriota bacterium]